VRRPGRSRQLAQRTAVASVQDPELSQAADWRLRPGFVRRLPARTAMPAAAWRLWPAAAGEHAWKHLGFLLPYGFYGIQCAPQAVTGKLASLGRTGSLNCVSEQADRLAENSCMAGPEITPPSPSGYASPAAASREPGPHIRRRAGAARKIPPARSVGTDLPPVAR
jgi:hypothetical protein